MYLYPCFYASVCYVSFLYSSSLNPTDSFSHIFELEEKILLPGKQEVFSIVKKHAGRKIIKSSVAVLTASDPQSF